MTNIELTKFLEKHISIDIYPKIIIEENCLKFEYSNKTSEVILNNDQVILVEYFINKIRYMQDFIYDLKCDSDKYDNE